MGGFGVRAVVAVSTVLFVQACWPTSGIAGQKVIKSSGPLSSIYIDEDLACQVQALGDTGPSFFGGTEPGACGTFVAFTEGENVFPGESRNLWGPSPPGGVSPEADYELAGQTPVGGSGTEANPFVVTTHVRAIDEEAIEVAELTETDSYVTGQDFYTTKITITNPSFATLKGTLYHAGTCSLSGLASGFGAQNMPSAGSVACTIEPNNNPQARLMAFTPLVTSGFPLNSAHFFESSSSAVWKGVSPKGTPFPNTIEATTPQHNGMGLSWPLEVGSVESASNTATLQFTTTVSPSSPPTSSSSAGAYVSNGQVPVAISAVNGAKAVDYALDGAPATSVATSATGQATIALSPGQHKLEYWAEDLTGAQESPHHVLTVTVATGGPSLTITSDQSRSSYELGEPASVTIAAAGPGLTSNPSAAHVPISTVVPGTFSVTRSAADACGTTSASFTYTVLPPPVLGKSVNVAPVSGKVLVALPSTTYAASFAAPLETAVESLNKGFKFIPLTEARQIPVGSTLETTAGVARITTATATMGKLQSGEFGAGIFKLLQRRKQKGLTELDIVDNRNPRQVCASSGKARAAAKRLSSKVLGRLTGTAHGGFTTRGQYSAATVRGTVWGVRNRCDGTLTKVTRGVVTVRDFRRRKTITLFTGQSYLAKAP